MNIYWHPLFGPVFSTFGCLEVSFADNSNHSLTRCFKGSSFGPPRWQGSSLRLGSQVRVPDIVKCLLVEKISNGISCDQRRPFSKWRWFMYASIKIQFNQFWQCIKHEKEIMTDFELAFFYSIFHKFRQGLPHTSYCVWFGIHGKGPCKEEAPH